MPLAAASWARDRRARDDPHSRAPFEIERHKRYALPVAAMVFGLVAFPLAIRSHRGGRSIALVGSLAILVTYYLMMTSLEGVALRTRIPLALAIWAPNVVFGASGSGSSIATAREWRCRRCRRRGACWRRAARAARTRGAARPRHQPGDPRDSTHIIDRYLVREYSGSWARAGGGAVLFMMIDLVKTLDKYLR